ncbi:N-glycosylase/DNA lyase [archaeon]|nr:N-glycosylase/DNA lyase [archaeon]
MKFLLDYYQKKKPEIKSRLKEFENNKDYFYELCFCILTPQSSAKSAWKSILKLKELDFQNKNINPEDYIKNVRFHINKSKYLNELKNNYDFILSNIKQDKDSRELREFLVKNVKGYGYKEASHFLRNIGHKDLAILDRHILKNLIKHKVINELPKSLTPKKYFEIENKFINFSKKTNMPLDHLDLLFWSQETGEIFK